MQYEAQPRGTYSPKLKFHDDERKETLITPKQYSQEYHNMGYYKMTSAMHGAAFIIETFTNSMRHVEGSGTDRDEHNLVQTVGFLGYRPIIFRNLTSTEIEHVFKNLDKFLKDSDNRAEKKVAHDSFICCILSHGNRGVVFGSDSEPVKIEDIERQAGRSETLRNKPKIFFIQASQGHQHATKPVNPITWSYEEPVLGMADIYTCMSSAPGKESYRYSTRGSWFVIEICKILCEIGPCCKFPDDFLPQLNKNMLNNKEYRFQNKYIQQPYASNQLLHCIHFFDSFDRKFCTCELPYGPRHHACIH